MKTKEIAISDYNYELADERIAKYPLAQRDHSKLLVYEHGEVGEDVFYNLPAHLPKDALMVFNNTRVIQARMHFRKESGALIEIFLLEPYEPADYEQMFQTRGCCSWLCLVGNLKKWKEGTLTRTISIQQKELTIKVTRKGEHGTSQLIEFEWNNNQVSFAEIIDVMGELPIPPYLNRKTEESDKTTYQTVYSKIKGSVAAPTAGLHFTPEVLQALDAHGIDREEVTLHVGAGTFKPVKSATIGEHAMHTEYIAVRRQTIEKLLAHDCQAIAVGTTSVRTLESLYYMGLKVLHNPDIDEEGLHVEQWEPYESEKVKVKSEESLNALLDWMKRKELTVLHSSTQIIIAPGYDYKIVKMLVTNFHQPQSTLLLLVSAFVKGDWRKIYDYALGHGFRFLSYGDSSLLIPILMTAIMTLTACGGGSESNIPDFETVIKEKTVSISQESNAPQCSVKLELAAAKGTSGKEQAKLLNETVAQRLFYMESLTLAQAADSFANKYTRDYVRNFGPLYREDRSDEAKRAWYEYHYNVTSKAYGGRKGVVVYEATIDYYEGGAHGINQRVVMNFDNKTGRQLTLADVFVPGYEQPLCDQLLKALVDKVGAKDVDDLRAKGYLYSMEMFAPENFVLGEDEVTFVYNPYEIAPYDQGLITLEIDHDELEKLWK